MAKTARQPTPNTTLYNLRDSRGLTQQELAEELVKLAREQHGKSISVDNVTISRWERGVIDRPSPIYRRLLAEYFGVSLDELGFTRPTLQPVEQGDRLDLDAFMLDHSPVTIEPRVEADQRAWKQVRRAVNQHRPKLARTAALLYDEDCRLHRTGLLARTEWMPAEPVPLRDVTLTYDSEAAAPALSGDENQSRHVRPLATVANRYQRYSHALRDIDHPGLFENRLSYRLIDIASEGHRPALTFGHSTYFESVDVNEALAHEVGMVHLGDDGNGVGVRAPSWRRLALRRLISDPFDFARRPVLTSINTLTIRNDPDRPTFVLHDRSAARVAVAGGTLHVMPAGVFQPSSILPGAQVDDFDLWRNVMREYSEEFLGNHEHGGDGAPVDYTETPFSTMDAAQANGRFRVYYLGLAMDALTLYGEVLTVAVIEPDAYDDLFSGMVDTNDEGSVVTIGGTNARTTAIPFDHLTVPRLLEHEALAPAAAGCLSIAWEHRESLLAG